MAARFAASMVYGWDPEELRKRKVRVEAIAAVAFDLAHEMILQEMREQEAIPWSRVRKQMLAKAKRRKGRKR